MVSLEFKDIIATSFVLQLRLGERLRTYWERRPFLVVSGEAVELEEEEYRREDFCCVELF